MNEDDLKWEKIRKNVHQAFAIYCILAFMGLIYALIELLKVVFW